jgi:O-antigen biosynthesis protein
MNRFWNSIIRPILEQISAEYIIEVGSDTGINTKNILEYCNHHNAHMTAIDPFPKFDIDNFKTIYGDKFEIYTDLSLSILPLLKDYDVVILDGDHNWYTVFNELKTIEKSFKNKKFPLIILHDVGWPYARRDLYYNPDNIPEIYRQPYKKLGIRPGKSNLIDEGGLNSHICNAIYENNPKNGVLTAIEDFIDESDIEFSFNVVNAFFGLGILYPKDNIIEDIVENVINKSSLVEDLEEERIDLVIETGESHVKNTLLQRDLNHKITDFDKLKNNLNQKETQLIHTKNELKSLNKEFELLKFNEKKFEQLSNRLDDLNSHIYEMNYQNNNGRSITQRLFSKFPSIYILLNRNNKGIKNALINIKGYNSIKKNNLLDIGYYLKNNPDVRLSGKDPILHYMYKGFKEGRNPNPQFDGDQYLNKRPDVKSTHLNPLVHYSLYGKGEGQKYPSNNIQKKKENARLSKKEVIAKYDRINSINLENIELYPFEDDAPMVSIVILNRNGIENLKRLFENFKTNIQYPSYEIIIVDNISTDDSVSFLEGISNDLPLKIIKNLENASFSKANNQAVEISKGDYILLLNNDVRPNYGWLNEMMQVALESDDIGAVGAKLVYPYCYDSLYNKDNSFKIQHAGIIFREVDGFIKPYNISSDDPFNPVYNYKKEIAAVTGAALLVKKDKYLEVDGLDEKYVYGYEDVDLCLKLLQKGYKNFYCPKSLIYHYEFGTQETNKSFEIRERRQKNKEIFKEKWNVWLKEQLSHDKLNENYIFSHIPKIAFAVTDAGENVTEGDYFTALEFSEALKENGWDIKFLTRRGPNNWYEVDEDVNIVISLIDAYDPTKINSTNKALIKIAWCRNWVDRWLSHSYLKEFDIILVSSNSTSKYIKDKAGLESFLFPIATNPNKFSSNNSPNDIYSSDYCFTGNYWGIHREIIDQLDPQNLPYKFNIYGKDWNNLEKFEDYHQGYINYSKLPEVYASTKIVVDDAVNVTKKEGSVNSRVFDALASGTLVLTNGVEGSKGIFNGKLPFFESKEELTELLSYYLSNETERKTKIQELQEFVLKNHTYQNRTDTLLAVVKKHKTNADTKIQVNNLNKSRFIIKIPAPKWETAHEWGDYHMGLGLKKELEKKGHDVKLQILPEWETDQDDDFDVVIVLRGLNTYNPKKQHFNIMWNISHPDEIAIEEYNKYDHVFIASKQWAEELKWKLDVPVETMLQCSDPELFYPDPKDKYKHDLSFIGNSRKVLRKILKDLLPTNKDLAVYGTNWKGLIPEKYIKGDHVNNNELREAYSSCKILLNDHWDDMREKGFISNRLFDGFASGAFIISDNIIGAKEVFDDTLITYNTPDELHSLIDYYLNNEDERIKEIQKGRDIVLNNHTFKDRVNQILEILDEKN